MQYLPSENWVGTSDEIDETDDLVKARSQLAMYVGRDTHQLSAAEIRRAVLETVSENGIDGVLAPLFYALLGLWLGAWFAPKNRGTHRRGAAGVDGDRLQSRQHFGLYGGLP